MNADTLTEEQAKQALGIIMDRVYDKLQSGDSIKNICKKLTWLSNLNLDKSGIPV